MLDSPHTGNHLPIGTTAANDRASRLVQHWRRLWNGGLALSEVASLFSPSIVFHFQDKAIVGASHITRFAQIATRAVSGLDLVPVEIVSHEDRVLLYYYWTAEKWHSTILGANKRSNLCQVAFRVREEKIVEVWQQAPDFIYLLGAPKNGSVMSYPQTLPWHRFVRGEQGVSPSEDAETVRMCELFQMMNACALGGNPLRKVSDCIHRNVTFHFGDREGRGIDAWKTFAYAMRTALGNLRPVLSDSLYIRENANTLSVYSRVTFDADSQFLLAGANGQVGSLKIEVVGDKIQSVYTCPENYIWFLGTDFTNHAARTRQLFQGRRVALAGRDDSPMEQPGESTASLPGRDDLAVIGMAGRFPNADSVAELWELLCQMQPVFSEFPDERSFLKQGTKIRHAALLDRVDEFDASFFNVPPVSAEYMDPQQRVLMEVIWHSIEDSAHRASDYAGPRTGLIIAGAGDDYKKRLQDAGVPLNSNFWMGNEAAIFPAKIARFLNVQGTCKLVNAECASSLFAIHEAMRLIRDGTHDQVIVGAANIFMHSYGFAVREDGLLSTESRPLLFSTESSGQLRGEAAVAVILKSLKQAIEDKDEIYGVLSGSAVNNSGHTLSISAAHVERQKDVILEAWRDASVAPSDISLIECHASGVRGGDYAEVAAIRRALDGSRDSVCSITSLKGCVGHAEAASGLSVLVKLLLQFRHSMIVGTVGAGSASDGQIDPALRIDPNRLKVLVTNTPWESSRSTRVAGINAFAGGGYNAHVVVREAPAAPARPSREPEPVIIVLSAKTEGSLRRLAKNLREYLNNPEVDLVDLAWTLQSGRDPMKHRAAFVGSNAADLTERLTAFSDGVTGSDGVYTGVQKPLQDVGPVSAQVDNLLANRNHARLAEVWCEGGIVPWESLYTGKSVRRISGLPLYPFARERYGLPPRKVESAEPAGQVLMARREWRKQAVPADAKPLQYERHYVLLCGDEKLSAARVESLLDGATCLRIEAASEAAIDRRYLTCAAKLFEEVQRIFRERKRGKCLIQLVCSGREAGGIFVSLSALLRSAQLEEPSIIGQVIEVDANESEEGCVRKLKENQRIPQDVEIRYQDGQREVFTLREAPPVLTAPQIPWRDGGVYLITGGGGRLALILAREILRQTRNVTLVLTDLAPLDDAMRREIAAPERAGSRIEYKQLDICDRHAVNITIGSIVDELGSLSGVIHMAGINRDRSIMAKTTREFEAVLSPKVAGTVYLDEATRDCALDFFVLFSSVAILGNPGQTDYATANSFLNAYTEHRDALVRTRRRSGRTLAMSWPLWRAGGMQLNESKLKAMVEHAGIVPMETAAGINVFYQALAANQTECFVFGGDIARIRECFLEAAGQTKEEDHVEIPEALPDLTMMSPAWKAVAPVHNPSFPNSGDRIVVFGGTSGQLGAIQDIYPDAESREIDSEELIDHLRASLKSIDHIVWIAPGGSPDSARFMLGLRDESVIHALRLSLIHLFRIVKALGSGGPQRNLGWTVITEQGAACRSGEHVNPAHAGVHGMIGSVAKEYPHWRIRLLDLERGVEWPVSEIFSLPPDRRGDALVRRGKEWFRQTLLPIRELSVSESLYRSQGVYVVIGGTGGIGEVWTRWMIQNYGAKIVWIGRRPEDEAIRTKINALVAFGPPPVYIQADAGNREALGQAYLRIKETHADIHGVVHSAVGSFDQSLTAMDENDFLSVLSAKVDVSVRLAQVFADEPLKFILFFSSLMSFSKAGGMSGYSAGCTFMDAFAGQLSHELPCAIKVMNWGYWSLGSGRAVSENMKARLERQGMGSIEADEGMRSLNGLLSGPLDRMAVAKALRLEAIEELDQSEYVTVYPEPLSSFIEQLPLQNPRPDARGRELIAQRAHEIDGMEELALRILFGQLDVAGLMPDKVGVRNIGFYRRWLNESFAFLQRGGFLPGGGSVSPRRVGAVDLPSVWKEWEAAKHAWNRDPSKQATVALVEVCLRSLPEILLGQRPATSVMFPNSSMVLVEGIYKDNLVSDYFNDVLADAVVAYVRKRFEEDPRTQLRILEIGAGTGGSTASILARLETYRSHIAEYCYSDISNSFLFHAESKFLPHFPFVRTQLFDVGKPLEGQQLRAGGYDLAIATNVLHATRNIRRTLRNAKAALRPHGLLLLNEVSRKTLFAHLTFGLLEGWWLNEDDVLRIPGSPGLTAQGWREVLEREGMSPVVFPVAASHELGQQIIVAESDGVVRQERIEQAGTKPTAHKQPTPARTAGSHEDDFNDRLREKCTDYFRGLFAKTLRMEAHKIDPAEPLESYGMDSILIVQVTNAAREVLDDVTSALFFEFQTIDAVVDHFIKTQKSALLDLFKLESKLLKEPGVSERIAVRAVAPASIRERSEAGQTRSTEAIAIIGVSGRYPQADTIERYWENLREGRDSATEIPRERWSIAGFYNPDPREAVARGQSYSKWGAFLDGIDRFDPLFFNLTPKDAELIDPQERLFLQEAWKALEDAGYAPSRLSDRVRERTGVFAGITRKGYAFHMDETARQLVSTSFASLANRVSYFMDLQGPSVAIDTMCSSSLVAIHQACQYLRDGKGNLAIAGGVHLYVHPSSYVLLCASQFLSPHSRTPSFEESGSGFVPGECVGALILKPLELALRDRDSIYALIPGSAVNQCGKTNAYGIPSSGRQAAVIQEALNIGAIDPRTIGYIEAAANGAQQSDAIEMLSLSMVFGNREGVEGKSHVGSVKPNIGHSESASGIAQLSKVIMALKHKTIPPTLVRGALNPEIQFDRLRFEIPAEAMEWKRLVVDGEQVPLRAGVTSIGAGGVNAHVILEEFTPEPGTASTADRGSRTVLFVLSAKSGERLRAYAEEWSLYLTAGHEPDLERTAYTLQLGREEMRHRLAIVCESRQELIGELDRWRHGGENSDRCFSADSKASRYRIDDGVTAAIERRNLGDLAKLWVLGNTIPWEKLCGGELPVRLNGLPTYPFSRKSFWIRPRQLRIEHDEPVDQPSPRSEDNENTVAFYSILAEAANPGDDEYLTFCPFPQVVPDFSMTRVALNPAKYPEEAALVRDRQIELRRVLFCREDFNRIESVLDIGCGHGTDVIQIAELYPHLRVDGFTITRAQADLGNRKIAQKGLTSQARIFHKDSSKDQFPGRYDLVLGIEVSFHIRDKRALFENISSAVVDGGRVLLIDYIANLRGPIVDPGVGISIPTRESWLELLSDHRFVIDEFIDLSPEISNYLHDPEFEDNIRSLPKVAQDTWRNYANQSTALAKGWISYCVLKLEKATDLDPKVCRSRNEERLRSPQSYLEALDALKATPPHTDSPRSSAPSLSAVEIKKRLEPIFCSVLGLDTTELRDAESFRELGVGSINAVELLEEINCQFDLKLPTSVVFGFHNLDALSSHLADCMPLPNHASPPPTVSSQGQVRSGRDDLAIIGLSCRCAGANDAKAFWEVLREGRDCIRDIADADWLEFFRTHSPTPIPARYGAMEGANYFDPLFFGISPKEAESMDVSQRVLLQECYRALEDGGYSPSSLHGKSVGAFIGAVGKGSDNGNFSHFSLLGEETSILASRISYFLDLKGPALAIDTACSSSLVAIDLACQALKNRSVDLAIAGGITIYNRPGAFVSMNNAGMLSSTGTCRPFDSRADGVVVGDGAGILVLKRLEDAENDGDSIYAVIRGCGTNQDGKTSGITVPSFLSQSQLQQTVYRRAGVAVEDIQYVAAHGTATRLGDPIEIHALTHSFRQFTQRSNFCALGSIKANIGHTTAAAGVMNVIAALLSLKNRQIPPSIHFSRANEHIEFEDSPFFVNERLQDWPPNASGSRMAAISSFGFSGTNAHMVLEEHFEPAGAASRSCESGAQLILISARDRDRLNELVRNLMRFIESEKDLNLAEIAYTLQVGRDAMDERLGFVADSTADLLAKLAQFLETPEAVGGLTRGRVGRGSDLRTAFTEAGELRQTAEKWMRQKKYSKLLELWVNGTVFDWEMLHRGEQKPRRIHLPGYPFARESYGRSRIESSKSFGPPRKTETARHGFDESLHSDLLDRYAAKKINFEDVMCLINGKPK